ncbi:hypothetical protein BTA51_11535 [Hahella sp. CCB-MM4]|uniref:DUF1439 domain-containing protein n=1 Tax=Hahella sp. (strain CCB-MM4) TaxID=1926491 RepID=UPI000B9A2D7A|nr:DUF1439 domain-containing protein [Hahella sp. CCB-MM4]OZG73122.1 hypothetical protein BTA51_11535 [Hahella sp. CCB-MM4]
MHPPHAFSPYHISRQIVRALAYRLALTDKALERHLGRFFPLETRKLGIYIQLADPRVKLDERANRIHLRVQLLVRLPGQIKTEGHLELSGVLVYDTEEGAFYLNRPEICEFALGSIPPGYLTPVRVLVRSLLSRFVVNVPLFKFRNTSLKHRLVRSVVRNVEVHRGKLRVRFAIPKRV